MNNKKGFVGDVLTWVILVGVMVMFVFFGYNFINMAGDSATDPVVKDSLQTSTIGWAAGWDFAIMAAFGLLVIVAITSAWFIGTNKIFFWITLITLIIFLGGVVVLSNLLNALVGDVAFMEAAANMPGTMFLVNNMFMVVIACAALLMVVLFAKPNE